MKFFHGPEVMLNILLPLGEIMFLSKTFGGRASDSQITTRSQFVKYLQEMDRVLADKGFPGFVKDASNAGAFVVMPPFKSKHSQFTEQENQYGYEIASVRIHVGGFP